jgi:hypothetical protein
MKTIGAAGESDYDIRMITTGANVEEIATGSITAFEGNCFGTFGTAGTLGTATGCMGTAGSAGTYGCSGGDDGGGTDKPEQ